MKRWTYLIPIILFIYFPNIRSQTCCSGGVPLTGNLGLPAAFKNTFQINLSYDQNFMNTLKNGNDNLNDESRKRLTRSALLETGYSITDVVSISTMLSYVVQSREINQFGNLSRDQLKGVGDGVILVTYKIGKEKLKRRELLLGAGAKLPLGKSDLSNDDGIILSADLQPGSGAWDGILWGSYYQQLPFRQAMSLTARTILRFTGTNKDYLGFAQYSFGNEYQIISGISDRYLAGKLVIDPSILFRFRYASADIQNEFEIPNTGGSWIYISPNMTLNITPSMLLSIQVEIPLYSNLVGTQLTTDYRFSTGIYYRINRNQEEFN